MRKYIVSSTDNYKGFFLFKASLLCYLISFLQYTCEYLFVGCILS